jgi:spoIIIJ-associated protein
MTEWVEVRGKTVKDAVAAGVAELGLDSPEAADVEILEEPERGFLGFGGRGALVRVKARAKRRRRRRRGKSTKGDDRSRARDKPQPKTGGRQGAPKRNTYDKRRQSDQRRGKGGSRSKPAPAPTRTRSPQAGSSEEKETAVTVDTEDQAQVIEEFLQGLLDAFGLDGGVETRTDDDIIYVELTGEQTEALIGPKGSVMQAVLELTRTVVHRKTQAGARIRLDIGGYAERRRAALKIYAGRLAEQIADEGGEVMLEPMNPADRKVVHDAVAEVDGVRSFSEGEEPERSVVVASEE